MSPPVIMLQSLGKLSHKLKKFQSCKKRNSSAYGLVHFLKKISSYDYLQYPFGKYITAIGKVYEEPGNNVYWLLYQVNGTAPNPSNPPTNADLTPVGKLSTIKTVLHSKVRQSECFLCTLQVWIT